jgi:hypothetical protein
MIPSNRPCHTPYCFDAVRIGPWLLRFLRRFRPDGFTIGGGARAHPSASRASRRTIGVISTPWEVATTYFPEGSMSATRTLRFRSPTGIKWDDAGRLYASHYLCVARFSVRGRAVLYAWWAHVVGVLRKKSLRGRFKPILMADSVRGSVLATLSPAAKSYARQSPTRGSRHSSRYRGPGLVSTLAGCRIP